MKQKTLNIISIRIILMFTTVMLLSFIPDYYYKFFGDWLCNGCKVIKHENYRDEYVGCLHNPFGDWQHNPTWHWGYRHCIWVLMGLSLFVIQVIGIIQYADNEGKDKEK